MHYQKHVFICCNKKDNGKVCCADADAEAAFSHLKSRLSEKGMHGLNKIRVNKAGCLGRCAKGPNIVVYPDNVWYNYECQADLDEILEQHLINDEVVPRLVSQD